MPFNLRPILMYLNNSSFSTLNNYPIWQKMSLNVVRNVPFLSQNDTEVSKTTGKR